MTFSLCMSIAKEQRCLKNHATRENKNRTLSSTVQVIRERFVAVPEDSPAFAALHRVQVNNPDRLRDLPIRARRNMGDQSAQHEDAEGEFDYLTGPAPPVPVGQRSAVGILVHGQLKQTLNGGSMSTVVGHSRTPGQRLVERAGGALPVAITNQGHVPMSVEDKVRNLYSQILLTITIVETRD